MIGVEQRRWANASISTADLCHQAATHLLKGLDWQKESIDALIFVSQTPDYRLPATACTLHGRLDLSPACLAFDINLGCSAYPICHIRIVSLYWTDRRTEEVVLFRPLRNYLVSGDNLGATLQEEAL